ncbi:collagen-like protein [Oligoflexia bacterium]|nr:collagen-like protein [Oligoflexia bacterium]
MKGLLLLLPCFLVVTSSLLLVIPNTAYAGRQKACVKEDGSVVIKRKCKTKKNESELNLSNLANTVQGAPGAKGESGEPGPQGAPGPSTSLTASELLALLKTVDGPGSGLDADTMQGMPPEVIASLDPVFVPYTYIKTAKQVSNITSAGIVPDMSLTVNVPQPALLAITFCARWYSNSNLSIVRLKARVDGVNASPSTVHVIPVANFTGTGKHQLRCFKWGFDSVDTGDRVISIYNNPTGNALLYERSLTVLVGPGSLTPVGEGP